MIQKCLIRLAFTSNTPGLILSPLDILPVHYSSYSMLGFTDEVVRIDRFLR